MVVDVSLIVIHAYMNNTLELWHFPETKMPQAQRRLKWINWCIEPYKVHSITMPGKEGVLQDHGSQFWQCHCLYILTTMAVSVPMETITICIAVLNCMEPIKLICPQSTNSNKKIPITVTWLSYEFICIWALWCKVKKKKKKKKSSAKASTRLRFLQHWSDINLYPDWSLGLKPIPGYFTSGTDAVTRLTTSIRSQASHLLPLCSGNRQLGQGLHEATISPTLVWHKLVSRLESRTKTDSWILYLWNWRCHEIDHVYQEPGKSLVATLLREQATQDKERANTIQLSLEHVYSGDAEGLAQANTHLRNLVDRDNTKLDQQLQARGNQYARHPITDQTVYTHRFLNFEANPVFQNRRNPPSTPRQVQRQNRARLRFPNQRRHGSQQNRQGQGQGQAARTGIANAQPRNQQQQRLAQQQPHNRSRTPMQLSSRERALINAFRRN